jgi:hypothetical protein
MFILFLGSFQGIVQRGGPFDSLWHFLDTGTQKNRSQAQNRYQSQDTEFVQNFSFHLSLSGYLP